MIDEQVGRRLRMRRLMLNITSSELANNIGIAPEELVQVEQGECRAEPVVLRRWIDQLGVRISWCFRDFGHQEEVEWSPEAAQFAPDPADSEIREEVLRLLDEYLQIKDRDARHAVFEHVQRLASGGGAS